MKLSSAKKVILITTILIAISFGCRTVEDSPTALDNQEEIGTVNHIYSSPPSVDIDKDQKHTAYIETNKGTLIAELFVDESPITVNNFLFLSKEGFYKDVIFHRIINNFMVQTGDPTGTGTGGPGYRFDDELVSRDYLRGTLAMANAGPNTNGSQFFIVHQDAGLPKSYTIFGIITEGLDVLDDIATVPVTTGPSGENSQPLERVFIKSIRVSSE
jgi:peptidylprolyl isomerase